MAQYNGYTPSFTGPAAQVLPTSAEGDSPPLSGNGNPEGVVVGVPGWRYKDLLTHDLYLKISGSSVRGWIKIGVWEDEGGGTPANNILSTNVDPNGVVSATGVAICVGYDAMFGKVWQKTTAGTSNNEWVAVIA